MASSTPPAHCTLTTAKTYQNHHLHHHTHRPRNQTPSYQNHPRRPPHFSLNNHSSSHAAAAAPRPPPPAFGRHCFPLLGADFSGRRSTKTVSKFHADRPRSKATIRHSAAAEEVLQLAIGCGGEVSYIDNLLLSFQPRLHASDDYVFLLRELSDRGDLMNAMRCFEFALSFEKRRTDKGKLATSMISTLGRFGKTDLAKKVFEDAVNEGYGNTIFAYSALIGAYAKSGRLDEAIGVFRRMKDLGLKPNTITYNSLIDACGKGGADYTRASEIFNDMLENGVSPDRVTYNSLLAVCSGAGLWEEARSLFDEMVHRGLEQDIYTYNTLLDVACSGGHVDAAFGIMAEMTSKNVFPNEVTYSTMIRGCAKAGHLDRALSLFNEMKSAGVKLDRVAYNTLLVSYADLGRFDEAFAVGKEMESMGIKKDVVTYNTLLDRFGKQGMYDKVKELFAEMKRQNLYPNLLTYSALISVYCEGGLYKEAMEAYKGFKQQGLKADVVFYSKLIHASGERGLVELAALLVDEMMRDGIQPNVVTYNSIINAFGQSESFDCLQPLMESSNLQIYGDGKTADKEDDQIIEVFRELACGKSRNGKLDQRKTKDFRYVLGVFREMHEMKIKPNVVTFSAVLNACSRCNSFEEASLLLEELRPFDNQVYGVAHGLLMGQDEYTWSQALSLFDDMKRMDSSTASGFYNALTDMLWHFGQKLGAQRVALEAKRREVWENIWTESCLDLHLMSSGAARAMVHAWLLNIRSIVFEGHELPKLLCILTGWGKHSKVVGAAPLKRAIEALLKSIGAPFEVEKCNIGRFTSRGSVVAAWLRESGTLEVLVLRDNIIPAPPGSSGTRFDLASNLQPVLL